MKPLPAQDFFTFVLSQPDDRPVRMDETHSSSPCGCVLIHYARSLGITRGGAGFTMLGINEFDEFVELTPEVRPFIVKAVHEKPTTYAAVKLLLQNVLASGLPRPA
jgi:hypothetical protein